MERFPSIYTTEVPLHQQSEGTSSERDLWPKGTPRPAEFSFTSALKLWGLPLACRWTFSREFSSRKCSQAPMCSLCGDPENLATRPQALLEFWVCPLLLLQQELLYQAPERLNGAGS